MVVDSHVRCGVAQGAFVPNRVRYKEWRSGTQCPGKSRASFPLGSVVARNVGQGDLHVGVRFDSVFSCRVRPSSTVHAIARPLRGYGVLLFR